MGIAILDWVRRVLSGQSGDDIPEEAELAGLSIGGALQAHNAWVQRFETALKEGSGAQLDPEQVSPDNRCILGKWLYDPNTRERFETIPEFKALRDTHTAFHREASLVIVALRQGNNREAQLMLDKVKGKSRQIRVSLARLC